jgi:hypothetical protein
MLSICCGFGGVESGGQGGGREGAEFARHCFFHNRDLQNKLYPRTCPSAVY